MLKVWILTYDVISNELHAYSIAVPSVSWDEDEVNIPEGRNREVCFSSDIGTAEPYNVMVGARPKGSSPATQGTCVANR